MIPASFFLLIPSSLHNEDCQFNLLNFYPIVSHLIISYGDRRDLSMCLKMH
jgi:hypothetical protein